MIAPPRSAELLLETLGAEPQMRDAVVGDLAEEYAWIVEAVDARTARRWYWREAIRAMPLLLRSSLRSATWSDVRRRIGIIMSAVAFLLLAEALVVTVVFRALVDVGAPEWTLASGIFVAGVLVLAASGFVAAWLDDRAPFASAVSVAMAWASLLTALRLLGSADLDVLTVVQVVGESGGIAALIALGGWVRLRQLASRARPVPPIIDIEPQGTPG